MKEPAPPIRSHRTFLRRHRNRPQVVVRTERQVVEATREAALQRSKSMRVVRLVCVCVCVSMYVCDYISLLFRRPSKRYTKRSQSPGMVKVINSKY